MTIFERIANWLFDGLIHRQRQQTRAYAVLALSMWNKLPEDDMKEMAVNDVIDAAYFVIEEDRRVDLHNWSTDLAEVVLTAAGEENC